MFMVKFPYRVQCKEYHCLVLYQSKYIRKVTRIQVNVVLSIWSFRTAGSQIDRSPDIAIIVVRFAISFGNSDIDPDCL